MGLGCVTVSHVDVSSPGKLPKPRITGIVTRILQERR